MKKILAVIVALTMVFALAVPAIGVTDGAAAIDKKAYDAFGKTEYSANNKTTKVTDCVALRANSQAGWFIEVCDGFIGTVDIAYKISNAYYKDVVIFDGKLNEFRIGDGSGKNGLNAVKFGAIWNPEATLVLMNGVVQTMDDNRSFVSAVAALDDKILFVGDDKCAAVYIGAGTEVINLDGQMVLPGFIDSHIHPTGNHGSSVPSLSMCFTMDQMETAIRDHIAANPNYVAYRFSRFNISAFMNYGDGFPDRHWLDAICPDKPISMTDMSGHSRLVNTKLLVDAGDVFYVGFSPSAGVAFIGADGLPTGYFSGSSTTSGMTRVTNSQSYPSIPAATAWANFQAEANSFGITSIQYASGGGWATHATRVNNGQTTLRANIPGSASQNTNITTLINQMRDAEQQYLSDYLFINSIKIFMDNVTEAGSGYLLEPYEDAFLQGMGLAPGWRSVPRVTPERWEEFCIAADAAGYNMFVHCLGDAAVRQAADGMIAAMDANGTKGISRHNITHATMMHPDDVFRIGDYRIILSVQPIWAHYDPWFAAGEHFALGDERFFGRMYQLKDWFNAGAIFTGSADYSVTDDYRPLIGIAVGISQDCPYGNPMGRELTTRCPEQSLSLMTMVEAYTVNGAYQMGVEDKIGSLEAGKLADMVILSRNIFDLEHDHVAIADTEIMGTILGGEFVFGGF